ncbi:class I adenylate-forming enzyme family protein [Orrella sp. JC864]|uniref:class I adenylate-forming enzyme family protein n=1 Tax=Orrella sp. JC864 TaxID=3120298 RepID=UPI0030080528
MNENATLLDLWRTAWSDAAQRARPALQTLEHDYSYAQLDERVQAMAGALRQAGVARGDYVALALERGPGQVLALLAAMAAGACPCPLEPRLADEETRRRVAAVGLRWMIHDDAHAATARAAGLPAGRLLALDALRAGPPYWSQACGPGDPGLLLFTSGSTGKPKGVLLSHRGLLANTLGVRVHTGLRPDDVLLHVMPLHHTNALNNQVFAPLASGACIALAPRFRAEDMPTLMERFRPTLITGVPTIYSRMLQQRFSRQSLARLRFARCGSAPITPALHREIEAFLGCELVVSYGLSEATCTSTMNPPGARRIGTVGTVLAGQQVVLLDRQGAAVPAGAEGEICIGGPALMAGYLGHEGESPIRDGWLRTGDLGRFDADGYLSITGRIKEVIIRGGENISPALVENLLSGEPGVAACCVVGRAHADLGEVPVAFVVPAAGGPAPDAQALREAVREKLGRIYVPEDVLWVDSLPENAVGKVDRKALARRLAQAEPAGAGALS